MEVGFCWESFELIRWLGSVLRLLHNVGRLSQTILQGIALLCLRSSSRGISNGAEWGGHDPLVRSGTTAPTKFLLSIFGHLGWKFTDYMSFLCQKLHVLIKHMTDKIFRWPAPLWRPLAPLYQRWTCLTHLVSSWILGHCLWNREFCGHGLNESILKNPR